MANLLSSRTRAESTPKAAAIIEYLLDTYVEGRVQPEKGTDDYCCYPYWLHYAEGSAIPLFLRPVGASMISKGVSVRLIELQLTNLVSLLGSGVFDRGLFAGDMLISADIAMNFPVEAAMSPSQMGSIKHR